LKNCEKYKKQSIIRGMRGGGSGHGKGTVLSGKREKTYQEH